MTARQDNARTETAIAVLRECTGVEWYRVSGEAIAAVLADRDRLEWELAQARGQLDIVKWRAMRARNYLDTQRHTTNPYITVTNAINYLDGDIH